MNLPALAPPMLPEGASILGGPEHHAHELRWHLALADGRRAVLAQLVRELAADEAVRRRYVLDQEQLSALHSPHLPQLLDFGPTPDPRDPSAIPPWRLSIDPALPALERWLKVRAPAPIDEACRLIARIATALHALHLRGLVAADLSPQHILLNEERVLFVDLGLHRTSVLSSRTAQSVVMQSSPYAAPERLHKTHFDQRADLYSLGVLLWRALTATLPFDEADVLRPHRAQPPSLRALRPDAPEALELLVERCLQDAPHARPASAATLADQLAGKEKAHALQHARCQGCNATIFMGQRLCLNCGKQAVLFEQRDPSAPKRSHLYLHQAHEDRDFMDRLERLLGALVEGPLPPLNFLTEDPKLYSDEEKKTHHALPVRLMMDLSPDSAEAIRARMKEEGFSVTTSLNLRSKIRALYGLMALGALAMFSVLWPGYDSTLAAFALLAGGLSAIFGGGLAAINLGQRERTPGLDLPLRKQPVALPASDPLVSRLAAQLEQDTCEDLRVQLGEMALWVQRLVDHRATLSKLEHQEVRMLTAPLEPLIDLIERHAQQIQDIDRELLSLEEGKLLRAIARSEAKEAPETEREALLAQLDHLRALEHRRTQAFHKLLEAGALLQRATKLGLSVHSEQAEHERELAQARAALEA